MTTKETIMERTPSDLKNVKTNSARQKIMLVLLICCIFGFALYQNVQSKANTPYEMMTFAMDTLMDFSIYTKDDGDSMLIEIEQEIRRLERLFSVTIEDSEVAKINRNPSGEPIPISQETLSILAYGLEMTKATDGAFHSGISPLVFLWGFTGAEEKKVPSQAEIEAVLPLISHEDIVLDLENLTVTLAKEGMALDFGGIAKGYVADVVTEYLHAQGVENALFSLGGNISTIGKKPNGEAFKIAVANPLDASDYVGVLGVADRFVVSSGGYQRYFEEDGKMYHHILDVKTGRPSDSDLLGVTIVSKSGIEADVLSTALFVLGLEESKKLLSTMEGVEVVFVTNDGKVIATSGVAEKFTFEGAGNDFSYEILE
ncbi:MAG: FAD:protein FMN transferase [Bacillota bacterium]